MMWIGFSVFRFRWAFDIEFNIKYLTNAIWSIYGLRVSVQKPRTTLRKCNQKLCSKFIYSLTGSCPISKHAQVSKKSILFYLSKILVFKMHIYKFKMHFFFHHLDTKWDKYLFWIDTMCVHCVCNIKSIFTKLYSTLIHRIHRKLYVKF